MALGLYGFLLLFLLKSVSIVSSDLQSKPDLFLWKQMLVSLWLKPLLPAWINNANLGMAIHLLCFQPMA